MPATGPHPHLLDRPLGRFLLLCALLLLCLPLLLDTYHKALSDWVMRDDYAPILLWLAGDPGPAVTAPTAYRPLSVLPALPLYEWLPLYRLSHGMDRPLPWLRATQALIVLSWACVGGLALAVFATARDALGTSLGSALAAGLGAVLVVQYTGVVGADPIGLLGVAIAWYLLDRPGPFAAVILCSALLNEKIAMLFGFVLAARWVFGDRRPAALGATGLALAAIVALRLAGPFEGAEHQLQPAQFGSQILATLRADLSAHGLLRALIPSAMAFAGFFVAWLGNRGRPASHARAEDVAGAVGLFLLAHLLATNVGRITLYSAPLFLPALALALDRSLPTPSAPRGAV